MKKLLIAVSCVLLLCGCTKSNIVHEAKVRPDMETKENVELVWDQIGESLTENFTDSADYPVGEKIKFSVDSQNKLVDLKLLVSAKATKEEAVEYATAVIRAMGAEVATQDFSYAAPESDTYGSFFDEYAINVEASPAGQEPDENNMLIDMNIPAGSHTPITAKE